MRTMGSDFFCGLTFPYKETHATLILGGWGGSLIGISSLDDFDASENETGDAYIFEDNQWYDVRLKVTDSEFTVWIDGKSVIDCEVEVGEWACDTEKSKCQCPWVSVPLPPRASLRILNFVKSKSDFSKSTGF